MALHLGLLAIKGLSKTAFELALEYYAGKIVKKNSQYAIHHIDEICLKESPEFHDTYAVRSKGYCSAEEALKKIESSDTEMAKNIMLLVVKLHEEDDFTILEVEHCNQSEIHSKQSNSDQPNSEQININCVIL